MPIFDYIALKNNKEFVKGKIEAASIREARQNIRALGFVPTKILAQDDKAAGTEQKAVKKNKLRKLSLKEKMDFTNTLQTLSQTGVPIIESLVFIENNTAYKNIKVMANELRRQIIGGSTFAAAVARYPEIFDHVFIGLVSAGEESGELDLTLDRMSELLAKEERIRGKVIGTLMYPCFVIVLATLVILVMLIFVFPAFKGMFDNLGKPLPWITQFLMDSGVFLKENWPVIPIAFGVLWYGVYYSYVYEPTRKIIDKTVLDIPLLKQLVMYSNIANFMAVLRVAYEAGVPIVDCLFLSNLTINNYTLKDNIKIAATKVQQGTRLSSALKSTNALPKMILFMIATGEESGRLGDMLSSAITFIDKELDNIVDTLTKMIEPLMLIVIGSIVLVLALALYLPLFQSYQS